jgi:hypothetical protein
MPDMQFVANRWLSTKEGDLSTYCALYPTGAGAAGPHNYKITVMLLKASIMAFH